MLPPAVSPSAQESRSAKAEARRAGEEAAASLKGAAEAAGEAVRQAGDAAHGAASGATAAAANIFLAQGGETQRSGVPDEVAEAAAARTAGTLKED